MRLPDEIAREIGITGDKPVNSRPVNPRKGANRNKQPSLSRKDRRKQKRQEKKQQHAEFYRKPSAVEIEVSKSEPVQLRQAVPLIARKAVPIEDEAARDERRLRKLAQSNPHFFKLLQQDKLVTPIQGVRGTQVDDSTVGVDDGKDDYMMRQYAKKLKLKNADKITSAFKNDGLDFLLDVAKTGSFETEKTSLEELDEQLELDGSEEDDYDGKGEKDDYDDDDDSSSLEEEGTGDDGSDLSHEESYDEEEFDGQDSDSASDDADDPDSETEVMLSKDSPRASGDKQQHTADQDATTASVSKSLYIPPHLRQQPKTKSEAYQRLKRQMQGHINRLTENNIEAVYRSVEAMYQGHPRHDVTEILTELVLNLVCDQANLLEGFVIVYACLISLVYNFIGADVGASIVQSLVECLDKSYQEHNESVVIAADQSVLPSKRSTNLTLLLCHLYNFQVVSQVLLYDLLDLFAGSLQELDVELLLKIIRSCGPKLRSDDPLRLKNMIVLLQEKSAQRNEPLTVRHKFMLEQIYDLKNNKSQKHLARELAEKTDSLRKLQRNLMKQYGSQGHEPLRCSLDDIHSVQQKGKWWVIGAAWVGRQSGQEHESLLVNQRADNELLALAKRMNINTDIRRSIFVVLMSSEDYADAFEKLLKLGLRDSQEREIVRMIVYLCGQEKTYNPFYAVLGERLCRFSYNHKITFQYTLWDFLKSLNSSSSSSSSTPPPTVRKLVNLARLFAELMQQFALSMSILKTVDFAQLKPGIPANSPTIVFLQTLLIQLLLCDKNTQQVLKIFNRVTEEALRQGLAYFLVQWIRKQMQHRLADLLSLIKLTKLSPDDQDGSLLKERIRAVKVALLTQQQ